MAKKVQAIVKLQIPAGKATPAPPVGTALGPHGVNIMDFCKNFNAKTASQDGLIIPAVVTIYSDRSYTFITKTPPAPVLLKRAANIAKAGDGARVGRDRRGARGRARRLRGHHGQGARRPPGGGLHRARLHERVRKEFWLRARRVPGQRGLDPGAVPGIRRRRAIRPARSTPRSGPSSGCWRPSSAPASSSPKFAPCCPPA